MAVSSLPSSSVETKQQEIPLSGTLQGFHDYSEEEHIAFDKLVKIVIKVFEKHGFTPFYPRPVEPIGYLCRNAGGEEITKQVFGLTRLQDLSLTGLGMPFDRTVPLASWVTRHPNITFPFKRYNIELSWRGEHAQPGRYRAFFQADIDIINRNITPLADAEGIATMYDVLRELGAGAFQFYLNHINIAKALVDTLGLPDEATKAAVLRVVDKMDKLDREEITRQVVEITGEEKREQVVNLIELFGYRGSIEEFPLDTFADNEVAREGKNQLVQIFQALDALGVDRNKISFSPGLVRGLEYYSGVVVETFLEGSDPATGKRYAEYGSIVSGGRFDNLVSALAESESSAERLADLKGTGISLGLTRLFDIYMRHHLIPTVKKSTADIFVGYRTQNELPTAIRLAEALRQHDIRVDLYSEEGRKIKHQLDYANKKNIRFVALAMSKEGEDKSIAFKDMDAEDANPNKQIDCATIDEVVQIAVDRLRT